VDLIYAGIDEAGYGPMLGPLTVAMCCWRVSGWHSDHGPPDLWQRLERAVSRSIREATSRVAIADSKLLKLPNTSRTQHPLVHLERGVLAAVGSGGLSVATDASLAFHLGASFGDEPWYGGPDIPLPVGSTEADLAIAVNILRRDLDRAACAVEPLQCRVWNERRFNELVSSHGTKGAVIQEACAGLIGPLVDRLLREPDRDRVALRIVCDRQGGRTDYRDLLARATPELEWRLDTRARWGCRYRLVDHALDAAVIFMTEAESQHLPVALASMTAKYVRELAMLRFNRYWCAKMRDAKVAELKPTAGYTTDARRWLNDAREIMTPAERAALVRIA